MEKKMQKVISAKKNQNAFLDKKKICWKSRYKFDISMKKKHYLECSCNQWVNDSWYVKRTKYICPPSNPQQLSTLTAIIWQTLIHYKQIFFN